LAKKKDGGKDLTSVEGERLKKRGGSTNATKAIPASCRPLGRKSAISVGGEKRSGVNEFRQKGKQGRVRKKIEKKRV